MPVWLATARAVHYGACTGLFGLSLFQLYAVQPTPRRAWLTLLALVAVASGAAWFALVTTDLAGALDGQAIGAVLANTSFGPVWSARMGLGLAAVALAALTGRAARLGLAGVCAALLAALALTGHTQSHEGLVRVVHVFADAIHLLGAGYWIGGLLGLALALTTAGEPIAMAVRRFSRGAYVAVAALIVSGLANAAILVATPRALVDSAYGRLLILKLVLFAGMLGFAAYNRFKLSPALSGASTDVATRRLRRNALTELLLAAGVLICVACLGMGRPPA